MIPWYFASIVASVSVITIEYFNRMSGGLAEALPRTLPLIALAQVALFFSYNGAPTLLAAWIAFSVGSSVTRLTMAGAILDEPLHYTWAGLGAALMVAASYCIKKATAG